MKCYCGVQEKYLACDQTYHVLCPFTCENIKYLNNITFVTHLILNECKNIKYIGHLIKLKKLTMNSNTKIYGLHMLKQLEKLILTRECYNNMKNEINKLKKINNKLEILISNEGKIQIIQNYYFDE